MVLNGNSGSTGIAIGKILNYQIPSYEILEESFPAGKEEKYINDFEQARAIVQQELTDLSERMSYEDQENSKIFMAHRMILDDEELLKRIRTAIVEEHKCTDYAVDKVFAESIAILENIKDPLIAARIADLYDVKRRLLRILHGHPEKNLSSLKEDVIIVAHDLLPSDAATMDRSHVLGIITEVGNRSSHSAIIARSYQIPAILGVINASMILSDGMEVILDATCGIVLVQPNAELVNEYEHKLNILKGQQKRLIKYENRPAITIDGKTIELGLNIGSKELNFSPTNYDFIGLCRTEFLYMNDMHMPTEEEQFLEYKYILEQCHGKILTLRTFDLGADKKIPSIPMPRETNPAIGKRALRFCLEHQEIFKLQLRAALRASAYGTIQIMFPMVGNMEDFRLALSILNSMKQELREENIPFDETIKVGAMIEIPSIASIADLLAKEVDFASIGTNDLTQFMCAADRDNPEVSGYYQELSPAMVRVLSYIFEEFDKAGKPVSVCGELAGNPMAAVLLIGLGARKLSMDDSNLAMVKSILCKVSVNEAKKIAQTCKRFSTEREIKEYLQSIVQI